MPTGNETELCRYIEKWLAEDGVACEIIESAPGRGNLIARLEGSSGRAGLMFMSHLDVVPVEEEEKWRFPPFSATVADGRVFGRGASDCKALLTCQLIALRILKRNWSTTQRQPDSGLLRRRGAWRPLRGLAGWQRTIRRSWRLPWP